MEGTHSLSEAGSLAEVPGETGCPRCGEPPSGMPPVRAHVHGGIAVRRCLRCGARWTLEAQRPPKLIFTCEGCGLPFLAEELLPHSEQRCAECENAGAPPGLPDSVVVSATEAEVRSALAKRWRVVTSPSLTSYLERVATQVSRVLDQTPRKIRVHVLDEPLLRTLALPSGTVFVSLGLLRFLQDEAELCFVLGHELAHALSGDAPIRLVRLGFDAMARGSDFPSPATWAEAAMDLVGLGYGRRRERDADARALEVMLALRYDPGSALRFLKRVHARLEQADPTVAESATSHPLPMDRVRHLERALWGRVQDESLLRVNREVFRRVAVREIASGRLVRAELPEAAEADESPPERLFGAGKLVRITALVLALVGLAVSLFVLLLR